MYRNDVNAIISKWNLWKNKLPNPNHTKKESSPKNTRRSPMNNDSQLLNSSMKKDSPTARSASNSTYVDPPSKWSSISTATQAELSWRKRKRKTKPNNNHKYRISPLVRKMGTKTFHKLSYPPIIAILWCFHSSTIRQWGEWFYGKIHLFAQVWGKINVE